MSARSRHAQSETTRRGEQTPIHGVRPLTMRAPLALLIGAPMRPRAAQKPRATNLDLF
ncbi:hypothetical protein GCM10010869_10480 [Mesorhizobium tianshanense]|uniref:Uncharacterized protein n=1 Tax=Mesorhizobium tianshanense TaxID=39844 RepID=A0A562N4G6_9HYPH|nr:hypothetical protein [Mesorhizobium tianshanense]TWI26983.1 hypothetical protein IQ26_05679 [Mesorhizobium tianshanense]GLS35460.1 hypothetical protein GCM10010869_10480 [Mesorhizobium tianshanense]